MGLERRVKLPSQGVPAWRDIRDQLARVGELVALRMIDGLPAFPDEEPEIGWREIRLGLGAGMVSLRIEGETLVCVVWSNADTELLAARDRVAWACAAGSDGHIVDESEELTADRFAEKLGLSPS